MKNIIKETCIFLLIGLMVWLLVDSFLRRFPHSLNVEHFDTPSCEVPRIQFPSQTDPPITVPPTTTQTSTTVTSAPSNFITSYFQQFSKDGVKDIINIKDKAANTTLSYYDTITDLQHIPRKCPEGYVYDTKTKTCNAQCPTFEKMTYPHGKDSSGVCTPKCTKTYQYYDIFTGDCNDCPIGYKSDGNNNCIAMEPCSHGAQYVDHVSGCQSCPFGQQFDSNFECKSMCLPYEDYNYDGTCSMKCPLDYQFSDPNYGCQNCPTGYLKDGSNQCIPAPPCPVGEFYDSTGRCLSECYVYDKYDANTKTCAPICSGANPIYNPASKECIPCPAGQVYSGANNTCVPAPTPPAPTCGPGFTIQPNGTCKSYCDYWRMNDTGNPTSCVMKCPNTQYFDNMVNFGCVDCPDGYKVDAYNRCQPPPKATCGPGYVMNDITNQCESYCDYWRINDEKNPRKCNLTCPLPGEYFNQNENGCAKCPDGYLVNSMNVCTQIPVVTCPTGTKYDTIDKKCKADCPYWRTVDPSNSNNCKLICAGNQYFDNTFNYGCVDCSSGWGVDRNNQCTVKLVSPSEVDSSGIPVGGTNDSKVTGNFLLKSVSYDSGDNTSGFKLKFTFNVTVTGATEYDIVDNYGTSLLNGKQPITQTTPESKSISMGISDTKLVKLKLYNGAKEITSATIQPFTLSVKSTSGTGSGTYPENSFYYSYTMSGGGGGGGSNGSSTTSDSCKYGSCPGPVGNGCCFGVKDYTTHDGGSGGKGGDGEKLTDGGKISTPIGSTVLVEVGKGGTVDADGTASELTVGTLSKITAKPGIKGGKGGNGGGNGSNGSSGGSGGGSSGGSPNSNGAVGSVNWTVYSINST
jgi:hypothetical protein